jgi:hypothetical protein
MKSLHLVSPPVLITCDTEHPLNRSAAIAIAIGTVAFIVGPFLVGVATCLYTAASDSKRSMDVALASRTTGARRRRGRLISRGCG